MLAVDFFTVETVWLQRGGRDRNAEPAQLADDALREVPGRTRSRLRLQLGQRSSPISAVSSLQGESGAGWKSRAPAGWPRKCLQTDPFLFLRDQRGINAEAGGRPRPFRQQTMPICRLFSTGATGLEPATSGVTGVTKAFQRVSPSRRIREIKRFRQISQTRVFRLFAPGRFQCVSRSTAGRVGPAIRLRGFPATSGSRRGFAADTRAGSVRDDLKSRRSGSDKKCQFAGSFTGATGLQPRLYTS
jgi:hypothetical protein